MTERTRTLGNPDRPTRITEEPQVVENPVLAFFLSYWQRTRSGNALPRHGDFVPKEVGRKLPHVVVADALSGHEDFRFRVVGTEVAKYFLRDGTGKTLREVFEGQNQVLGEGALWVYRRACTRRIPVRATGPHNTFRGIVFPNFDALYLPYSSDGENADRIVNIFTFDTTNLLAGQSTAA